MGGMIAQLVAFNYPDRCKSLISVMSTSGNPKLPRPSKEVIEGLIRQPKSSSKEDVIENNLMTRKLWASPKYPTSEEILREKFSYRYDRMYYPDGSTRQYAAIGDDGDRTLRLKKISLPTLVLHGSSDNLVPLEAGKDTHRNISGSNIEIIDGNILSPFIKGIAVATPFSIIEASVTTSCFVKLICFALISYVLFQNILCCLTKWDKTFDRVSPLKKRYVSGKK